MTKRWTIVISSLLVSAVVSPLLTAQSSKPSIVGTVTDTNHQKIPHVAITVIRIEPKPEPDAKPQGMTLWTEDFTGAYAIPALPAGTYTLTAVFLGFTTESFKVEIKAGMTIEQNVTLKVAPRPTPPCTNPNGPCA